MIAQGKFRSHLVKEAVAHGALTYCGIWLSLNSLAYRPKWKVVCGTCQRVVDRVFV